MKGLSSPARANAKRSLIPRTRGALVGTLLILLGGWGVMVPFVGQEFGLPYGSAGQWEWTAHRGWLQVLPGLVTILGGAALVLSRNRFAALLGAFLSAAAGVWFIAGRAVAEAFGLSNTVAPSEASAAGGLWAELANFTGLGAIILFLAALILGRVSVRSMRDIRYADSVSQTPDSHADSAIQPHGSALNANSEQLHAAPLLGGRDARGGH